MALDWSSTRGPSGDLSSTPGGPRSRVRRLAVALDRETAWRLAPVGLLVLAAVAYLWNLTASGYANTYYSAAAQAASQSWSAMFFGAIDAAGFITVDKPPALAVGDGPVGPRAGPQPVRDPAARGARGDRRGAAPVGRASGASSAARRRCSSGIAFALTPAAVLMFRYNNPDAAAGAAARRGGVGAGPRARGGRPALGAPRRRPRRVRVPDEVPPGVPGPSRVRADLARRGARLAAAAGSGCSSRPPWRSSAASAWWVADRRPRAGRGPPVHRRLDEQHGARPRCWATTAWAGSSGAGPGPLAPGGWRPGRARRAAGGFGGVPGPAAPVQRRVGGQIAWLLPAAGDRPRRRARGAVASATGRIRAGPRSCCGARGPLVHALVFSLMGGIVHAYYAVALAPALAALAGGGVVELWRARSRSAAASVALGAMVLGTAVVAWQLLERTPAFWPGVGLGGAVRRGAAALAPRGDVAGRRRTRTRAWPAPPSSSGSPRCSPDRRSTRPRPWAGRSRAATRLPARRGGLRWLRPAGFTGDAAGTSEALVDWLVDHRGDATWLVAVTSASQAGPLQLASGVPVMAMGGFMGSDPAPTLEQLQADVRDGTLRYVLLGGAGRRRPERRARAASSVATAGATSRWSGRPGSRTRARGDDVSVGLYDCAGAAGTDLASPDDHRVLRPFSPPPVEPASMASIPGCPARAVPLPRPVGPSQSATSPPWSPATRS